MSDYTTVKNWMDSELQSSGSDYPRDPSARARELANNAASYFGHAEWTDVDSSHWVLRAASRAVAGKS